MKTLSISFLLLCLFGSLVAQAQNFSMKKYVISNGGEIIADATSGYKINGTIGQPTTAISQGNGFLVKSGFWQLSTSKPELIFNNSFE